MHGVREGREMCGAKWYVQTCAHSQNDANIVQNGTSSALLMTRLSKARSKSEVASKHKGMAHLVATFKYGLGIGWGNF